MGELERKGPPIFKGNVSILGRVASCDHISLLSNHIIGNEERILKRTAVRLNSRWFRNCGEIKTIRARTSIVKQYPNDYQWSKVYIIIRMHLYFYAVPIIAHVHAHSRFFKHCMNSCHTWRTTGKTIYTTKCMMTTYFHHRVPHNLTKCLCPFPASHKCNQLFNTLQSSSWTATINIENTCLTDVDTPAKVSCWNVWSLDHTLPISIHFQHQQHQLLFSKNPSHSPSDHSFRWTVPPQLKWSKGHFQDLKVGHSAFCGRGGKNWENEGPPKRLSGDVRHAYIALIKQDVCTNINWVFPKIEAPQNGWFIMEYPNKMDDLRVPLFSETPS